MTLRIFCVDETAPIPRDTALELSCDGEHEAPPAPMRFDRDGCFIAQHSDAMKAGWLETHDRRGRIFLGPCCSGKRIKSR